MIRTPGRRGPDPGEAILGGMSDTALDLAPGSAELRSLTNPAAYPVLRDVSPRYGDLGPDGHLSTVAVARWFEDARVGAELSAFRRLVEDGEMGAFRILLAAQRIERLAPLPWNARYRIGLGVLRVGGSSFTYGYGIFADETCVALGDTVTVFGTSGGNAELPDALRRDLAGMLLDEPGAAPAYRPGESRRSPGVYPVGLPLRARVGDIDTNRHANNVALVAWYAEGAAALATEVLGTGWGGPPPELSPHTYRVQYVAEVGYPAEYDLRVGVTRYDADTVHYAFGLFLDDRCVGLADATGARGDLPADALDARRLQD